MFLNYSVSWKAGLSSLFHTFVFITYSPRIITKICLLFMKDAIRLSKTTMSFI